MSSAADPTAARALVSGSFRGVFLAVAAFHSESTRAKLEPAQFHRTLEELLAGADAAASQAGVEPALHQDAKYAVVALCDDLALHMDWDHAEDWNQVLLELRHFKTSFAGQEFFDRLARVRQVLAGAQEPRLKEQATGVLEVYYTCLRLGFRGRYRNAGPAEVEHLMNSVLTALAPSTPPSRTWPDAYTDVSKGRILLRGRVWWWPIPAAAAAAVALWFLFSFSQIGRVDDVLGRVRTVQAEGGDEDEQ